jgi:hypothetical protein
LLGPGTRSVTTDRFHIGNEASGVVAEKCAHNTEYGFDEAADVQDVAAVFGQLGTGVGGGRDGGNELVTLRHQNS